MIGSLSLRDHFLMCLVNGRMINFNVFATTTITKSGYRD